MSSGCIYSGQRSDGKGFTENDPPNFTFRQGNCSFYSGTKALGEEALRAARDCYIWRLRMPFHEQAEPRNYLTKLVTYQKLLDARNSLSHLHEFVRACLDCWSGELPFGTYNLTNGGAVTTREIVDLLLLHGAAKKTFEFFDSEDSFMREVAIAPRSTCVLDNTKALKLGLSLRDVLPALEQTIANSSKPCAR